MILAGCWSCLRTSLGPAAIVGGVRLQADLIGVVDRPGDDDASRTRDDIPDVGATIGRTRHVRHVARVATREPLLEICELGKIVSWSDAAQIKAKLSRFGFDPFSGEHQERDTSCLTTYGRMPPWRKAISSSGVSTRAVTVNSPTEPSERVARTRTSPRAFSVAPAPTSENSSVPVSFSEAAFSPALNCSGSTPMFTRLLR